jgi:hypothetical protein
MSLGFEFDDPDAGRLGPRDVSLDARGQRFLGARLLLGQRAGCRRKLSRERQRLARSNRLVEGRESACRDLLLDDA